MVGADGLSSQSSCCARLDVLRGGRGFIVSLSSITSLGSMRIVVVLPGPYSLQGREFVLSARAKERVRSDSFSAPARSAYWKTDHAGEDRN